jgi:hypothetical protein
MILIRRREPGLPGGEELETQRQQSGATPVGKEPEVPNPPKSRGQHVQKKARQVEANPKHYFHGGSALGNHKTESSHKRCDFRFVLAYHNFRGDRT